MNNTHSSNPRLKSLRKAAIDWFIRMHQAEPDHPERGRFESWLMTDASHAAEYAAIADVWDDFNSKPQLESLASAMDQKELMTRQHATKVKRSIGSALGMLLAVTIGLFGYQAWQSQPVMHMAINAEPGQISVQALQDGSKLMINANSDVEITYYRNKRMVKLNRGEVIFEVARDESRPFIVDSGHAKVTVLGTRFAVNRLKNMVRISVDHGRVRVEPQDLDTKASGTPIILHDGQVAEVRGSSPIVQRVQRTAADAFSFINGVVTFDRAGIQEIAETLSRYRKLPVSNEVSAGNDSRITAVIKSGDVEKFLRNLPDMAPVSVQSSSEQTLIVDRTTQH